MSKAFVTASEDRIPVEAVQQQQALYTWGSNKLMKALGEGQIVKVREKARGTKLTCVICDEPIRLKNEVSSVSTGRAHWNCAGVEGELITCPDCFMIASNCSCS
jgi:hypothetical protein